MKKGLIIIALIFVGVSCAVKLEVEDPNHVLSEKWEDIDDEKYGLSIPRSWSLSGGTDLTVFYVKSPVASDKDKFRDNLNLTLHEFEDEDEDEEQSLESFKDMTVLAMMILFKAEVLETNEVETEHYEAIDVVFTAKINRSKYHLIQRFIIADGIGYTLTFLTEKGQMPSYRQIVLRIMDSFYIKPIE